MPGPGLGVGGRGEECLGGRRRKGGIPGAGEGGGGREHFVGGRGGGDRRRVLLRGCTGEIGSGEACAAEI